MLRRYHVPHNVSHHIDYITPGIKLMTGGNDEKIRKRMIGRRHLTGDLGGKARKGGKGQEKGKGKGKCKPRPTDPGPENSIFKVTGPCSDEITPQCIRSKFTLTFRVYNDLLTSLQRSIRSPMAPELPRAMSWASSRVWGSTTARKTLTTTGDTLPRTSSPHSSFSRYH